MFRLLRDAPLGQILRPISTGPALRYPEELPGFSLNFKQTADDAKVEPVSEEDLERNLQSTEHSLSDQKTLSHQEIVSWYGDDDPENPQNWSLSKKIFVTFMIDIYTFSVYVGSSIYTPSIGGVMSTFDVGNVTALLGLALYVLAYGTGSLLFSPLSEIPVIGRTTPYIITFGIFVILNVPTALVDNFAGLMILRFLLGFFGSPCLATSGATFQDIWSPIKMSYVMMIWAAIASLGPAFGPTISAYAVSAEGWRWSSWELLWISGPVFSLLFCCLPETSSDTILLRRARRLRKQLKRDDLRSEAEIKQAHMKPKTITWDALIKPWQINILDPAILFSTFYTGLVYGVFYSFFISVPLVFPVDYGFSLGSSALVFLSVFPALLVSGLFYAGYYYYRVEPKMLKNDLGVPEDRLFLGMLASFVVPIGLFLFAWTARPSIQWIVPCIALAIVISGTFIVLQCLFLYIPLTYPKYAASLFAANSLARSVMGAGAVLVSEPMFDALGIDGGVSLLGGLTILCIGGMFILYSCGARLRARSRFAVG